MGVLGWLVGFCLFLLFVCLEICLFVLGFLGEIFFVWVFVSLL